MSKRFTMEPTYHSTFLSDLKEGGELSERQYQILKNAAQTGFLNFMETGNSHWFVSGFNDPHYDELGFVEPLTIARFQMVRAHQKGEILRMDGSLLGDILDIFEEAVQDGVPKIPYKAWRLLNQQTDEEDIFYLYPSPCYKERPTIWNLVNTRNNTVAEITLNDEFEAILLNFDAIKFPEQLNTTEMEENNTMMSTMNFDFGPCNDNIAISPYGLAVKSKNGKYLTYDAKNGKTIDVTGFTFNFKNAIYKMPAATKDLREGTMVLHQGKPMFVTGTENGIEVVDILASEAKTILPVSNMFGFDYVTTVVSLMNLGPATPSNDNPFGNLMPFMMAQMFFSDENNGGFGDADMGKMMMFSMMTGQQNPFANFLNPINN